MHPEATHMHVWAMSDRAIPRSFRMMQGFGVNTYSLINSKYERSFVKFIFTPELGVHSLVWDEALKIAGQDPDFHRKDLWEAIENGAPPKWKFGIQIIPEKDEHNFEFDILDATKLWPEELVPIRYIGELELNRNVDNFFCEVEQAAFCTSHIIPGIDFSDDPLLQGRNFSYFDTQVSRLGINWQELPINRPICPVMNFNRDGAMRHTIPKGTVNYWPNRFEANPPAPPAPAKNGGFVSYPAKESGIKARMVSDKFKDHISQAQLFYNSLSPIEKMHATNAYSFELDHCDDPIVYKRMAERLAEIDLGLAQAVAEKTGAPIPEKQLRANNGKKAKGLSQLEYIPQKPTIKSRRIAILIADGYDPVSYEAVKAAVKAQGALPFTIAPKRQKIEASVGGNKAQPDHTFEGMRSTLFDAIFVPDGQHSETLRMSGLARFWVREAFGHSKAIGAVGKGIKLVEDAVHEAEGVRLAGLSNSDVTESYGVVTVGRVEDSGLKKPVEILKEGKGFIDQFFYQISQHRCWQRELDGLSGRVSC
jgi:catalase